MSAPRSSPPELARPALAAAIDAARQRAVGWDDLRERRVLGQIQRRLDRQRAGQLESPATRTHRAGPRGSGPRRRATIAMFVSAAAAAIVVVGALAFAPRTTPRSLLALPSPDQLVEAPGATPVIPHVDPARLTLADGSIALLSEAARVEVLEQDPRTVRVAQASGRVRYEVVPDAERSFAVQAGGVTVRVIGTVFTVDMMAHRVAVTVERGIVELVTAEREVRLTAGETIELRTAELGTAEPDADVILIEDESRDAARPSRPSAAPGGPEAPTSVPSVDELLDRADRARAAGDSAVAALALGELVAAHPDDPRAISAYFQLGKVERVRGRHAAAARAFERCVKAAPKGALAEDARAEAAVAWSATDDADRARDAATAYLDRYPAGTHAAHMRRLLDAIAR